jgi:hypothetical protein
VYYPSSPSFCVWKSAIAKHRSLSVNRNKYCCQNHISAFENYQRPNTDFLALGLLKLDRSGVLHLSSSGSHFIDSGIVSFVRIAGQISPSVRLTSAAIRAHFCSRASSREESMGLDSARTELSCQYVDHNLIQEDHKNPDDHLFLLSACQRFEIWYSRAGNGVSFETSYAEFTGWVISIIRGRFHFDR